MGNVPAHKYMKIKTAKERRRVLVLESVEFQPETREDTPSSRWIKFYTRPLVDPASTYSASRHFRSAAVLEHFVIFQKAWILPDTGKEAWKRWETIFYLIAKWLLSGIFSSFSRMRKNVFKEQNVLNKSFTLRQKFWIWACLHCNQDVNNPCKISSVHSETWPNTEIVRLLTSALSGSALSDLFSTF